MTGSKKDYWDERTERGWAVDEALQRDGRHSNIPCCWNSYERVNRESFASASSAPCLCGGGFTRGELGGISLPQVRRAMDTWVASVRKTTTDTERREVRRAVEKLQGASYAGKRALLDELTHIGTFDKEPDAELLRFLL